jgi:hypothetical protein
MLVTCLLSKVSPTTEITEGAVWLPATHHHSTAPLVTLPRRPFHLPRKSLFRGGGAGGEAGCGWEPNSPSQFWRKCVRAKQMEETKELDAVGVGLPHIQPNATVPKSVAGGPSSLREAPSTSGGLSLKRKLGRHH